MVENLLRSHVTVDEADSMNIGERLDYVLGFIANFLLG